MSTGRWRRSSSARKRRPCPRRRLPRSSGWRASTAWSPASAVGPRPTFAVSSTWTGRVRRRPRARRRSRGRTLQAPAGGVRRAIAWPWTVESKAGVALAFHHREALDEAEAQRLAEEVAPRGGGSRPTAATGPKDHGGRPAGRRRQGHRRSPTARRTAADPRALRRRRHDRSRCFSRPRRSRPRCRAEGQRRLAGDESAAAHRGRPGGGRPR